MSSSAITSPTSRPGLRAPYIVAGILCAVSMLAALPFLLSADRGGSADRPPAT